ncbi:Myb-Like DNA-Binding protein [Sarcoptes scabiei]|uniref:Myb-Like DNA-Binding protein n=1 Tax=Sarcoptes scabiei TaxID=52283 RepID=A0A132AH08_SARSC|nr:Myb-Like DNA-Binding protein [Sarcoptes scabiei]
MSTLPSNYLSSHGHLLHEIYDISNKKPRIANHGFLMSDSPILSNQISNPQSLMCSSGHLSNLPTHIGNHQHGVNRANCFPNIHSSENTALSTASNNDSDSSRMPKNLRLSSSDFYVNNLDDNVEDGYNPHFEAISPTPNDESRVSPITSLKDQILSSIHGCDRQIQTYEALINVLKSKAQQLEAATSKHPTELEEKESQRISIQEPKTGTKQIYAANKIVADEIHKKVFSSMFVESPSCLPLYNQPSDLTIIHEVRAKFKAFQPKLIKRIKELKKQKQQRIQEESSIYDGLMKKWLKKIEDYENSPAKKARDAKLREYFEKQFTEMRKHREDRERMHRNDQRTRTDVEIEENDGCSSIEDSNITKMRNLIVIPPIMLSAEERQRNIRFNNQNGFLKDPVALYKMSKNINIWTESEREIFKVKYLMNPKKFGFISQHLERKSTADCVEYYYLSKKHVNYKQMLRKHVKKRTRAMIRAQQQQIHQQAQSNSPNNLQNQSHLRGSPSIQRLQIESATNLSFRPNPQSATSLILPYSLPISSTSSTIILTIPSKTSTAGSCLQIVNKSSTIEEIPNSGSAGINSSDVFSENPCDTGDASSDHNKKIYSGASLSNNLTTSTDDSIKCLVCGDQIIFGNTDPSNALDCESSNTSNNSNEINKRICLRCHLKKNIKRQCPILSCNAPKKKAKSLKVLPQQWIEMSIEIKKDLADELKIPIDAKIGCACCVMRINRRIGLFNKHRKNNQSDSISINTANSSNNRPKNAIGDSLKEEIRKTWSDSDIEKLRNLIKNYGKDWAAISLQFNSSKSSKDCSRLFSFFKNELKLLNALKEHYSQIGRQYDPETDDEGMSSAEVSGDETTSSLDEINNNESDTASASSSVGCRQTEPDNEERSNLQDYKPLSLSQGSLKSDYDSSATMSADESSNTNENSAGLENRSNSFSFSTSRSNQLGQNADENDPIKNSLYSTNGSSFSNHYNREKQIMFDAPQVPHFLINPNAPSVLTNQISQSQQQQHSKPSEPETTEACKPTTIKCKEEKSEMSSGTCVRDLIWKAIEKSLQIPSHNLNQGAQTSSTIDSNAPINLKRDTTQKNYPDTRLDFQPSLSASKSFVNKNKCDSIVDNIKPEGLVMNFPHNQYPAIKNEPDACDQVQDLSNKPRDRSRANEVMARNSPKETGKISKLESPYSTNLNKHSESFNHPLSFQRNYSVSTNYPIQPAHSNNISNRIPNLIDAFMPSQIPMESKAAHFRPNSQPLIKINSKSPQNSIPFSVSPKSETPLRDKLVQPMVGSITQGTPVVLQPASNQPSNMPFNNNKFPNTLSNAQSMLINSSSHHSGMMPFPSIPNYEIFRHMTNELPKGSITQGTPLIIGTNSNTLDITQSQLPQVIGNASIQSQNQSVNLRNKNPDNSDLCCPNKRIRFNEPNVTPNIIHHDMMERINKTHFEQSVPTQSHSIYHRPFSPNYMKHYNLPQNIKDSHFNQILIDFNTSKQMQSRRNSSSSDKEIVESSKPNPVVSHQDKSNRSLPHFQDPQSHSPSSSIYLQDRPGDKVLESQLLQWNNLNMGSIPNTGFLSRQNVIQHGYPVVSKNTSLIQLSINPAFQ